MKTSRIFCTICILVIFVLIDNCSHSSKDVSTARDKILVKAIRVKKQSIAIPIHTSGILALEKEMKLAFKTGGIIQNIFADEGDAVKRDDLLAQLDVSEIEAQVVQAHSGCEKAQRDLDRAKQLYADSVVTFEQYQNAQTALNVAKAQVKIAEFNLQHSTIKAPMHGKILKRLAEVNELISPGMPVFLFGSLEDNWIVRAGVTDREILELQTGDSADVIFDAYENKIFKATVSQIAGFANPMTGIYEIELTVPTTGTKFISGFVAKVDIFPSQSFQNYLIPIEALVEADGENGIVYTLSASDTTANKTSVRISRIMDDLVAIASGLEDSVQVITEGAQYLEDGRAVKLLKN